jgi:hypothetical protein
MRPENERCFTEQTLDDLKFKTALLACQNAKSPKTITVTIISIVRQFDIA